MSPEREVKMLRRKLSEVTEQTRAFLYHHDVLMLQPSTMERGHRLARLANELNSYNDGVRYGILGVDFRKDKPWRPKTPK